VPQETEAPERDSTTNLIAELGGRHESRSEAAKE